jgi:glycolate oxidase
MNALARLFAGVLPAAAILASVEARRPYECDALAAYRQLPGLVLLPATAAEVARCLQICARAGIPVVARGAGTGLSGGALPHPEGVLLVLARLNRILALDPARRQAVVEPGLRNLALSEAAAPHGLYYAPDPSSQLACTLGGNVAENSGGVHCLKYGLTVHNVLGLKLLTMDGEPLSVGGAAWDAPGYDLPALLCGSEGLLGVVVEITVRLLPLPPAVRLLLAGFPSVAAAGQAVAEIVGSGVVPAGLEMMDRLAIQVTEDFCHAGYPRDAEAVLLCELDGEAAEVAEESAVVEGCLAAAGAYLVRAATGPEERRQLWLGRKSAFPALGRIAPDYLCMDGTIPRRALPEVLERIAALSAHYGLPVANVFHAGDGNLHPLIAYDINRPGDLEKAEALGRAVLSLAVAVGGTITGEHGVGWEKLDAMCEQFGAAELACFHGVKAAFDPLGLLNPGKAIPTLHRCAELGAMHVHGGRLPHADLPRF